MPGQLVYLLVLNMKERISGLINVNLYGDDSPAFILKKKIFFNAKRYRILYVL